MTRRRILTAGAATFGPEVVFTRHPGGQINAPPTSGGLYFGHVRIDAATGVMTVSHRDVGGAVLDHVDILPQTCAPALRV